MAGNVLRSRRSYELMIVGAIMAAALAHQAHESQAQILARLIVWDRQRRRSPGRESCLRAAYGPDRAFRHGDSGSLMKPGHALRMAAPAQLARESVTFA